MKNAIVEKKLVKKEMGKKKIVDLFSISVSFLCSLLFHFIYLTDQRRVSPRHPSKYNTGQDWRNEKLNHTK